MGRQEAKKVLLTSPVLERGKNFEALMGSGLHASLQLHSDRL